jgi:hypothetical protein
MAIAEPVYEVVRRAPDFEVRRYAPYVVAEVVVEAPFSEAGSLGFRPLVRYIGGQNRLSAGGGQELPMTAPVLQEPERSQVLPMTAPVLQGEASGAAGRHAVQFVMPPGMDLARLPRPADARVTLREVPGRDVAVLRYSGWWTEGAFRTQERRLREALRTAGLESAGQATWARYNQPFSLWFMRRNEVWLPLATPLAP